MNRRLPYSYDYGLNSACIWAFNSYDRLVWITLACIAPPFAVTVLYFGMALAPILFVSLVTVVVWQGVFAEVRKRPQRRDVLVAVVAFVIIAGPGISLWHSLIALSFGVVLGDHVFGGRGFGFLNPVVVALAFVIFAFPTDTFSDAPEGLALASIPGAVVLLLVRALSWRLLAGFLTTLSGLGFLLHSGFGSDWLWHGKLLFIVVFLLCDPMSSASTNAGRWANGAVAGILTIVFTPPAASGIEVQAVIPAILLGSLFAPLIDRVVISVNIAARAFRHG